VEPMVQDVRFNLPDIENPPLRVSFLYKQFKSLTYIIFDRTIAIRFDYED
jgi:hypothetical protein